MTSDISGIRIRCHQLNPIAGDVQGNTRIIIQALRLAESDGIDLLIVPELAVCGYSSMDWLEQQAFIDACSIASQEIAAATGSTAIIFGTPDRNNTGVGRPIFNAAILADHGSVVAIRYKTLLPTYDVFDELRYFEPATSNEPVLWRGYKLGITICEDIWNVVNEKVYHVYDQDPSASLKKAGSELIVNISASPFTHTKAESRRKMLTAHAHSLQVPFVYCNQCGAHTEVIYDGDSMMVNAGGEIATVAPMFIEGWIDATYKNGRIIADKPLTVGLPTTEERTFRALITGIRDYYQKSGIKPGAVIGLSGGIDSAVVAVMATEALGAHNVIGITMPSDFSSDGSISDSQLLAQNLGIECHEIPISNIYVAHNEALNTLFQGTNFGLAEENLQSRIRGALLMAYSNKFGHLLLNTGNKSELAVGYCTLYGDMNGSLGIISDLYKMEVYALANWLNSRYFMKEIIPLSIINKEPSAELAPDQKDSDSLPPYPILDAILRMIIEEQRSGGQIIQLGYDADVVNKIIRLVTVNEFKRRQAPPGLRLGPKAFGIGRRIPIVQRWPNM